MVEKPKLRDIGRDHKNLRANQNDCDFMNLKASHQNVEASNVSVMTMFQLNKNKYIFMKYQNILNMQYMLLFFKHIKCY